MDISTQGSQESNHRSCNGCTACCEGWLSCNIYGNEVKEGKPCIYLKNESCSIYSSRPENPCRRFKCTWLDRPDIVPESFWPKSSNVIFVERKTPGGYHYLALHCMNNQQLPVEILDWTVQLVQTGIIESTIYSINGRQRFLSSSKKFVEEMQGISEQETSIMED